MKLIVPIVQWGLPEDRDFVTLPNPAFITQPVNVVRANQHTKWNQRARDSEPGPSLHTALAIQRLVPFGNALRH